MSLLLRSFSLALVLLLAGPGCSSDDFTAEDLGPTVDGSTGSCNATDPRTVPLQVAVLPDQGDASYTGVISRATKQIRVLSYLMGKGTILDGLKQKAQSGVSVRVILDNQAANQSPYSELSAAGVKVAWSDPKFPYMHAKVIIGDEREAIISTGNFLASAVQKNRDFTVLTADREDVDDLIYLFDTDWSRQATLMSCTRLIVSPINARARILALIGSAKSTLTVESMQLADTEVRNGLASRKKAGVVVRVIIADPGFVDTNVEAAQFLKSQSIPGRYLKQPTIHAKAIVSDGKTAYLGSVNLSSTSMSKNREVGLITTEAAAVQRVSSVFERDWSAGLSLP